MTSEALREFQAKIEQAKEAARAEVLAYIDRHGMAYSRELRDRLKHIGIDLHIGRVQKILQDLEREGVLESWLKNPPHDDKPRSGLQRRYYKRLEQRCTGHCCQAFTLPYSPAELRVMLTDQAGVERCEDHDTVARMVIPIQQPDYGETKGPSGRALYWYTCRHLQNNGDCAIYLERPRMCRDYPYGERCPVPGCTFSGRGRTWKVKGEEIRPK